MTTRTAEVPLVNGYYLPNWFSIVLPEATENLVLNPSVEINTTGYTAVGAGAAIARTIAQQRRGAYALQVTPAAGVASGVYYGTITTVAGTAYTLAIDIKGVAGHVYNLYFATAAGALLGSSKEFVGTGYWQRMHVSYPETAALARRFYIVQDASDAQPFYVDGWQVEAKSYPTTYCDGDLEGFVIGEVAYYWTGTYHGSSSVRAATTRSGGRLVNLNEFGFNLLGAVGLGLPPVQNFSLPSNLGGAFYQNTIEGVRSFSIVGDMNQPKFYQLSGKKMLLEEALSYNLTPYRQPLLLHFQETDDCGVAVGDEVYIKCVYEAGVEGNTDNLNAENFPLQFSVYDREGVWIDGNYAKELYYETVESTSGTAIRIDNIGEWHTYPLVGIEARIEAYIQAPDGRIFAGGFFSSIDGVLANNIAVWNGSTWAALGAGVDNQVNAMTILGSYLYVTGQFANAGGGAAARIARYNLVTGVWSAIGAGLNNIGFSLASDPANLRVYVGGQFTSAGGVACNYIAYYNVASGAFVPLAMGANNGVTIVAGVAVNAIVVYSPTEIYVGGFFNSVAGGTVAAAHIAKWSTSLVWSALGTGMDSAVYTLAISDNKNLFVGGEFNTVNGVTSPGFASWNGTAWTYSSAFPANDFVVGLAVRGNTVHVRNSAPARVLHNLYVTLQVGAYEQFATIEAISSDDLGYGFMVDSFGGVWLSLSTRVIPTRIPSRAFYNANHPVFPKILIESLSYNTSAPTNIYTLQTRENGRHTTQFKSVAGTEKLTIDLSKSVMESDVFGNVAGFLDPLSLPLRVDRGGSIVDVIGLNGYSVFNDNFFNVESLYYLTGLSLSNTTGGILYMTITAAPRVDLFSDPARATLVGHTAVYAGPGAQYLAVIEDGGSGLGGYLYMNAPIADNDIYIEFGFARIIAQSRILVNSLSQARYA